MIYTTIEKKHGLILTWVVNAQVWEYLQLVKLLQMLPKQPIQRDELSSYDYDNSIHLQMFSRKTGIHKVEDQCVKLDDSEKKKTSNRFRVLNKSHIPM